MRSFPVIQWLYAGVEFGWCCNCGDDSHNAKSTSSNPSSIGSGPADVSLLICTIMNVTQWVSVVTIRYAFKWQAALSDAFPSPITWHAVSSLSALLFRFQWISNTFKVRSKFYRKFPRFYSKLIALPKRVRRSYSNRLAPRLTRVRVLLPTVFWRSLRCQFNFQHMMFERLSLSVKESK